jgi:hypothetical protein
MQALLSGIPGIQQELITGGGKEMVPPGLLGPTSINKGQERAFEVGGIAGYTAAVVNDEPVYFQRVLKNGKSVSWGSL